MAEPRRTRIQDVAEQAGVSMMTVSRVLNQDKKVSNKTREKVMAVVEKLNYRPNVSARRLASSKSFFIGLLYDNPSDSYISQFLLAALKKCRALGYHLVVDEAHLDINKTIESVKQLIDVTQVDGMILLPPMCDNEDVLEVLTKANVERLINQGHKKIAHIIGNNKQGVSRLRYQGYLDALRSNKITTPPEYIEQGSFTYQSGMEAAVKLLALDDKPTAIFAANDDMAAAVISIAQQQGINIPGDLSVVGFDDTQLARSVWPHISTVKQPINEMAELSVSLLASGQYDNMSNLKSLELRHILDFELIERESSSIK